MKILHLLLLSKCLMCLFPGISVALDTLDVSRTLSGNDTLVSGGGTFELGFFSPGNSMKLYLGIWYKDVPVRTVVWVANRDKPINDSSGSLRIINEGKFILSSQNSRLAIWSTNSTRRAHNPVLQLLDTGNLVLRNGEDENPDSYLWQSFDCPTDTLLPDMKIGWDSRSGVDMRLSSWKSPDDPSPGDFTWRITHASYPETLACKGSNKYFRGGPWNGLHFSGAIQQLPNPIFSYNFTFTEDEAFYMYHVNDKSLARIVLNQTYYHMEKYIWSKSSQSWVITLEVPKDYCDSYGLCGAYGKCLSNAMGYCECLTGFMPKDPDKWTSSDWSQGCVRNKPLDCKTDGFTEYPRLKLPDTTYSLVDKELDIKECRERCLRNCSCTAYTNSDIRGRGSGCVMWFGNLIDIREFPPENGQTLFIRMPASELDSTGKTQANFWIVVIVVLAFAVIVGMFTAACYIYKSKMKSKGVQERAEELPQGQDVEGPEDDFELPIFDLAKIVTSTNNFSEKNKLGEGGFGAVYKGVLEDGQEIAVKRLSSSSRQGMREFKNEVILIAKLQHRNLVKLLGCCIEQEEKMLIYEYMPNKSLDAFLFDETRSKELDWGKRFNIICGVARGILYLHQDSRLRIIHRDLKASNVLLDKEMHPKISDFGMARIFGGDQSECNTNRVVGTYGYMAPEYAIDGLFSVKSDVFSFGILVLEAISGKRNRGFYHAENSLAGQAWKLYNAGKASELIDPCLVDTCTITEVLRCIHICLLCLQEHPEDRPSMSSVVVMLSSETPLPVPKQPGFLSGKTFAESSSSSKLESCSVNDMTVTLLDAR